MHGVKWLFTTHVKELICIIYFCKRVIGVSVRISVYECEWWYTLPRVNLVWLQGAMYFKWASQIVKLSEIVEANVEILKYVHKRYRCQMKEQRKRFPLRSIPFSTQFFLQLQTSSPPPPPHTHIFLWRKSTNILYLQCAMWRNVFYLCGRNTG